MNFCFITASNSETILRTNLLSSPDLSGAETSVQCGAVSAAQAYNRGIAATKAGIMIFAHQDMFLPGGWLPKLQRTIESLEQTDPHWGVLGMFGVTSTGQGEGYVYSTGLRRLLGTDFAGARPVETLDEIVLVFRRDAGLAFDQQMSGFHLYGADICLQARNRGLTNYAFSALGIHNTNGIAVLPWAYWQSYLQVRKKWHQYLPVMTPCMPITRGIGPALRYLVRNLPSRVLRKKTGRRIADPVKLLAELQGPARP